MKSKIFNIFKAPNFARSHLVKLMKVVSRIILPNKNLSKRNQKIAIGIALLTIIIVIPVILYSLTHLGKAEAAWFNENFGYRQIVAITNAGSAQTDFQVAVTLDTATLITAGKMQSNCNDIRITDTNGRLLPYWIETGTTGAGGKACNASTTQVWTKIPSIPTSGQTLYLYYGNPQASSYSDGNKVFEFFDDFSGSSIDSSKWSQGTIGATSGTSFSQSGGTLAGGNSNRYIQSVKAFTGDYAAQSRSYTTTDNPNGFSVVGFYGSSSNSFGILDHDNTSYYRNDSSWINFALDGTGQWSRNTTQVVGTTATYTRTGETSGSATATGITNSGISGEYLRLSPRYDDWAGDQNYSATWDWVLVRKTATTAPSVAAPASEEKSPAPIAYWKFDEGTGTTANDASSNRLNGSFGGTALPAWKPESECISGKCLFFDSSNTANNPSVLLNESSTTKTNILTDVTISLWIKPVTGYNTTSQAVMRNGQGGDLVYSVFYDPTNQRPYFHWYDGTFKQVNGTTNSAPLNKWSHIEIVRSGTTLNFYVNGNLTNSDTVTAPTVAAGQLAIGQTNNVDVGQDYHGYIDDVKIYNYARTAAQVKTDYSSRGSVKGVSTQIGGSDANQNLSNGLVGFWKMDESSGNAVDSSGNGLTATAYNTPTFTSGKFGNSTSLVAASSQYFDVGDPASGILDFGTSSFSMAAWVKTTATGYQRIISKGNSSFTDGYLLQLYTGTGYISTGIGSGGTAANSIFFYSSNAVNDGNWHHVVAVFNQGTKKAQIFIDGQPSNLTKFTDVGTCGTVVNSNVFDFSACTNITASSATSFNLGRFSGGNEYYNGQADEARIYNRALSPSEVSQLYNYAPGPMGYWNFEEGSGNSVNDTSGNASTGTWNGTGATHWSSGKYGKAGKFNGTDDYVGVGQMSISSDITVAAWVYSSNYNQNGFIVGKNTVNTQWELFFEGTSLRWRGGAAENTVFCSLPANNQWHYIVGKQSGTTGELYVDGVSCDTGTLTAIGNGSGNVEIGRFNGGYYFNGKIDDVKVYNYLRSAGQIVSDMNAGHPNVGSPVGSAVGHWKFDEGYGTNTNNSGNGGPALNGTITSATWKNDGKFGKALSFDGTNSYVNAGNSSSLDLGGGDFTVSTWIYPTTTAKKFFLQKSDLNDGWNVGLNTTGNNQIFLEVRENGTTNSGEIIYNSTIQANNWYYITVVKTGANITVYKNGVSLGTQTGYQNLSNSSVNFQIGRLDWWGPSYFLGLIDEVKIYNSALTASEVKLDYNRGASQVLGSMSDTSGLTGGGVASNSASAEYCVPGDSTSCASPVGRWDFEEGTGSTVNDISGNANTGTWNGTLGSQWKQGKVGKGGNFNGSNNYVDAGTGSSLNFTTQDFTIELWTNVTDSGGTLIERGLSQTDGYSVMYDPYFHILTHQSGSYTYCRSATPVAQNTWQYWVAVKSSTGMKIYLNGKEDTPYSGGTCGSTNPITSTRSLTIGTGNSWGVTTGKLDQVRIFNYARTPAQVAWDYNRGAPVGYWKMDECQGGSVNDSSGNGNNGTITIGATGTQTSAGTCSTSSTAWGNGATGKYNASLNFDGTDDYTTITDSTSSPLDVGQPGLTVSAWIYPNTIGSSTYAIVNKNGPYLLWIDGPNKRLYTGLLKTSWYWAYGDTNSLAAGQWQHIIMTYDGTSRKLYLNGKQSGSTDTQISGNIDTTNGAVALGYDNCCARFYFDGKIDDTRIYNYALTPSQVKQVFNQGAGIRFGPATGAP